MEDTKNNLLDAFTKTETFMTTISEYESALLEIETKLSILRKDFSLKYSRNPFESIKSRIKKPLSIFNKLERLGYEVTIENMQKYLNDIAGIRVICSFIDDIYTLADALMKQDDLILIEKKDYIKNPKPNGYKSLHLILEIPIFLAGGKKHIRVEVQFRTIAMDFWASLEHKLRYKKDLNAAAIISCELKEVADMINMCDQRMLDIRNRIYSLNNK